MYSSHFIHAVVPYKTGLNPLFLFADEYSWFSLEQEAEVGS